MNSLLSIAPEVSAALAAGRPVVALESTIISHGMPYPQNLEMAQRVEGIIREEGAVPATIAVADGRIHVGLDEALLHRLATAKDVAKLSRRDLGGILASGGLGATTVAATMIAAHLAGIRVFATGGIGGVHRGAETSFDVSADLDELARTPVAVVCAGAKSILDLPKTLEYLETRGVPVIGYGTDTLPAFFSRSSGLALALRRDTPEEVAALLDAQAALGFPAGAVIANPIPEAHALPEAEIDAAIASALADAGREGVGGKEVTPYLLARIVALTGGRSLTANIALVEHNARLGARIAKALAARA
ncbi:MULTISPECIES: pseudouridine-5'-phosphate glycosidase [unclassified Inquilinus]|uniref:pseudouridine-5'-phosphate glycosidase n=1 Tax=unclassified Inquilinus TaxID=2645927 RepID=UPI003F8E311D